MQVKRKQGQWSEAAIRVLRERYLMKDATGQPAETPDELCWRVATAIAAAEDTWSATSGQTSAQMAEAFYDLLIERKFLPNSPTLMNAGKGNNLQLSACYVVPVEDSLAGIFDAIKHAAIIHQSGGGCIAGDAHVFTTFCGIEAIGTLYERVRATGRTEDIRGDHAIIDVTDLGIQTMALNPEQGTYAPAPITHLWRYHVPLADQVRVRCANGLEVTTSRWHPFMVFDGSRFVARRADELRPGDILPTPNASVRQHWPFASYQHIAGVCLDEDIAWLLGYYLGGSSLDQTTAPTPETWRIAQRRLRFNGCMASLERARDILARRFNMPVQGQRDVHGRYSLTITDAGFIHQFRTLLGGYPQTADELPFPEMIAKSPLSVIGAFLAGLVDANSNVDSEHNRVTVTLVSPHLARKVHTLCSLLGLAPDLQLPEPYSKECSTRYDVRLSAEPMLPALHELIGVYLTDQLKATRPAQSRQARAPQPPISDKAAQARRNILEHLAPGATTVSAVETPEQSIPFYDFTVAGSSTYLAGTNGLTAIHNTGFSFSRLRPEGSTVSSTHGVASGPVSFMRVFDQATEAVKQGGTRRGANMGILRCDHPDILKFIESKLTGGITNFNISVAITDEFMRALAADEEYDLVDPHTRQVTRRMRARDVFDRIVQAAWATGDPGLIFIDRINHSPANPTPELWEIEATNPCGEQPLAPYEACNLGSINLAQLITTDPNDGQPRLDWDELARVVELSVRFLDDVIEVNPYPLPIIHEMVKGNRRIGLGVMGWADLLFRLNIPYDSEEALDLAEQVMAFINEKGHRASEKLAEARGPFPNWPRSIYRNSRPIRNATVTTIAPTGSISIIANCSSGIEPIFALAFIHRVKQPDGSYRQLRFINPLFVEVARKRGFYSEELMNRVLEHGSVRGLSGVPEDVQRVFVTAHEIEPAWHVRIQAAFQKHTDNAVSKTINLPNSATPDDVRQAYLLAWELGCLGITVFRDGSKGEQVLNVGVKEHAPATATPTASASPESSPIAPALRTTPESAPAAATRDMPSTTRPTAAPWKDGGVTGGIKPRPTVVYGYTRRVRAPEGNVNVTINSDEAGPLEVFLNVGKAGSDISALAEALGRLISLNLRIVSPLSQTDRLREIADMLRGIGGSRAIGFGPDQVRSLPDAVARALDKHLEMMAASSAPDSHHPASDDRHTAPPAPALANYQVTGNLCPNCGSNTLVHEEGCLKCYACGHSEC